jgi:fibronectin type 3 domain-containing protein
MFRKSFIVAFVAMLMIMFTVIAFAQTHDIKITWDPVVDLDPLTYKIYMSTDGGSYVMQGETETDVCEYTVSGLESEHKYCFAVSAVDPAGNESAMSAERPCKDYLAPGVPVGVGCQEL